jgi:hypothetical protein
MLKSELQAIRSERSTLGMQQMNQPPEELAAIYTRILYTFSVGQFRLWGAEAASCRLSVALMAYHHLKGAGNSHPIGGLQEVCDQLDRIPFSSFDSMTYVRDIAHLVYATTLFDTFLTDSTVFLLLLFPDSIGKSQVSLSNLLAANSRSEIITQAAVRRAREISYSSFLDRIKFLQDTFGLKVKFEKEAEDALGHYPSVRNIAVHDQGIFELTRDDDGRIHSHQKRCAIHPTPLKPTDVELAAKGYEGIVKEIARAIMADILKMPEDQVTRASSLTPEYGK